MPRPALPTLRPVPRPPPAGGSRWRRWMEVEEVEEVGGGRGEEVGGAHLGPGEVSLLREEVAEARERAGDSVLLRLW